MHNFCRFKMYHKVLKNLWLLRFLPHILFFNFKMLPFNQAVKLPIWLYKPKFGKLTGAVVLDIPLKDVKMGMIKLGEFSVNIYPNSGVMLDIRGHIVFKGKCHIGNNSYISVGEKGVLEFGDAFSSTTSLKLCCYNSIKFGNHDLIGWDCLFMDTDFHRLTYTDGRMNRGYGPIIIGDEVWVANGCKVFKNTSIPSKCVISSGSNISGDISYPQYSVIGPNTGIIVKRERIYRNWKNDVISYN